jgi:hypothetical protein
MNVIVKTERPGFVENSWVGQKLALGDGPRLSVALPDPRCVMTTLAQDGLPQDTDVLRTRRGPRGPYVGQAFTANSPEAFCRFGIAAGDHEAKPAICWSGISRRRMVRTDDKQGLDAPLCFDLGTIDA